MRRACIPGEPWRKPVIARSHAQPGLRVIPQAKAVQQAQPRVPAAAVAVGAGKRGSGQLDDRRTQWFRRERDRLRPSARAASASSARPASCQGAIVTYSSHVGEKSQSMPREATVWPISRRFPAPNRSSNGISAGKRSSPFRLVQPVHPRRGVRQRPGHRCRDRGSAGATPHDVFLRSLFSREHQHYHPSDFRT